MKPVIIINGYNEVGKDTVCSISNEFIPTLNISSIDPIKKIAELGGWIGGKTEKDRKFLSDLKLLFTAYNDLPYRYIAENINLYRVNNLYNLMYIHIREPEEIQRVKNDFSCMTLLVENENIQQVTSNMADANVNNYKYDFIINNNSSLEDLRILVKTFLKSLDIL